MVVVVVAGPQLSMTTTRTRRRFYSHTHTLPPASGLPSDQGRGRRADRGQQGQRGQAELGGGQKCTEMWGGRGRET